MLPVYKQFVDNLPHASDLHFSNIFSASHEYLVNCLLNERRYPYVNTLTI